MMASYYRETITDQRAKMPHLMIENYHLKTVAKMGSQSAKGYQVVRTDLAKKLKALEQFTKDAQVFTKQ